MLDGFNLTIPAGSSLAIVGQNGAGKTTLAKLLCRLYDPQNGAIEVDGVNLRDLDLDSWRGRLAAVFQDFIRFEMPLRDNVAPYGAPDWDIREALAEAGFAVAAKPRPAAVRDARSGSKQIDSSDNRQPRRGPKPGATGFDATDRLLFPEIDQIRGNGQARSIVAAARILANAKKIAGAGSPENRATRLARRYAKHRSEPEG